MGDRCRAGACFRIVKNGVYPCTGCPGDVGEKIVANHDGLAAVVTVSVQYIVEYQRRWFFVPHPVGNHQLAEIPFQTAAPHLGQLDFLETIGDNEKVVPGTEVLEHFHGAVYQS